MNDIELTRMEYMPSRVRTLFVGESVPAKGRFFYHGGCGFTSHTRTAFELALGRKFSSDQEFLSKFRDLGCWLDDLSRVPVDHLNRKERDTALRSSITAFVSRLTAIRPEVLVVMLKRIKGHIEESVRTAGLNSRIEVLPFPGFGHQGKFIKALVPILSETIISHPSN